MKFDWVYVVWALDAIWLWSLLHLLLNKFAQLSWLARLNRFGQNRVLMSLREGFIALLPYYVIMATTILASELLVTVNSNSPHIQSLVLLVQRCNQILVVLFPLLVVVSVSYQFSRHLRLLSIFSTIFTSMCFICFSDFGAKLVGEVEAGGAFFSLYAVFLAVFCPYLLSKLSRVQMLKFSSSQLLSPFLKEHINLIAPSVITFFFLLIIQHFLSMLGVPRTGQFSLAFDNEVLILIRSIGASLLWFIGVHGINVYDSIFDNSVLSEVLPNGLSVSNFFNLFVYVGGNVIGATLACLWIGKRHNSQAIAKISLPFSLFNISEIIIYGLPLVCNPIMLIPTLTITVFHCLAGLLFIHLDVWQFSGADISWLTPVFIDAWWATGDWTLILYQAVVIVIDMLIFMPFIYVHDRLNNPDVQARNLKDKLAFNQHAQITSETRFTLSQTDNMTKDMELSRALKVLNDGELTLYYQPKLSSSNNQVLGFEALLRLIDKKGEVISPWFISVLGQNQMSQLIDGWVVEQVGRDLEFARIRGLIPHVSVNLHPHTLGNIEVVNRLIEISETFPEQIEVEILETSLDMDNPTVNEQLKRIRNAQLPIAIDDFGSGYSNLSRLFGFAPEVIKLDKSLLMASTDKKGINNYKKLTAMCRGLGYKIVAEGVETKEQLELVKMAKVDLVQGWIFSPALPWTQALQYQPIKKTGEGLSNEHTK